MRLIFDDEARGEKYFDFSWGVSQNGTPGEFVLTWMLDGRGEFSSRKAGDSIGREIKAVDVLAAHVTKHSPRGVRHVHSTTIKIERVELLENGFVRVFYVEL